MDDASICEEAKAGLEAIARGHDADAQFRALLDAARALSGCPTVALRLRHGSSWMPMVGACSVPAAFLRDEALLKDTECICGRVVRGDVDPNLAIFTENGSFYCGHLQRIFDEYTSEQLGKTRGRCIRMNYQTVALVPVKAGAKTIGLLYLSSEEEDVIPHERLSDIEVLCKRAGRWLSRLPADERERQAAHLLKDALVAMPASPVAGLEVGASVKQAGPGEVLGGDFCEATELSDGRALLVVGDVAGEGIEVAGLAAQCRRVLAELAHAKARGASPASLLAEANLRLVGVLPEDRFTTVVAAIYDPRTQGLSVSLAGHPEPLLLEPAGCRTVRSKVGPPLGVEDVGSYESSVAALDSESTLIMYTDGVLDARGELGRFGREGLVAAAGRAFSLTAQGLAQRIVDAAAAFAGSHHTDDMLTLTARLVRAGEAPRARSAG